MNKKPKQSLVQYQAPIQISNSDISRVNHKKKDHGLDSRMAIDQLLSAMFSPIVYENQGKTFKQVISTNPPSREDVNALQKLLDQKLVIRQARYEIYLLALCLFRDSGICPIRQQLHKQCFDQIIRQVTIESPQSGMLLMRVRDQLYMTISAYQILYENSLTFSMRKQLQSEQGAPELQSTIVQLQEKKGNLQEKCQQLKKKQALLQKQIKQRKDTQAKKKADELDFLKYQANHLQNFLRSVNESNK